MLGNPAGKEIALDFGSIRYCSLKYTLFFHILIGEHLEKI